MSNYAHPETLVETQWLVEHLEDSNIRIVEMDLDPKPYKKSHIPGSIFWSAFTITLSDMQLDLNPDAISKLLSESGIDEDTTIVATHRGFAATSGCIFWLLKVFGHRDVRILNGGCPKWQQENLPLTNKSTTVTPTKYKLPNIDNSLRISTSEVQQCDRANTILLDVRTPQEYQGEIYLQQPPQPNERAGHIPGAVNIYYELAHNKDTTFKSAPELEQLYNSFGVSDDKLVIPYCAVGARSAHTWFILKYLLGYSQVKNYDGSWNVWSKTPNAPVTK